ncbi:MAG: preprotein translocase subunit SecG [Erythrobacter sp.]
MSLFLFLTVVQALVAAALVGAVLMQRSEGGGLGIGGSPSGAFGARGSADFLTRATRWLAIVFVAMSIVLAGLAVRESGVSTVSSTLERGAGGAAGANANDLLADPLVPAGEGADEDSTPAEAAEADPLSE